MSGTRKRVAILIAIVALGGAIAAVALPNGPLRALVLGGRPGEAAVQVTGNIEVTDAEVSFKIPGRVATRSIDEGQRVDAGQLVATLETADLEWELKLREAELRAASVALEELRNGSRPEEKDAALAAMRKSFFLADELIAGSRPQLIQIARAEYDAALAEADRLERELGRATSLLKDRVVAREVYDRAKAAYDVAAQRLDQASEQLSLAREGAREQQINQSLAALDQAIAQYDLVMAGPREEDIRQAEAREAQATAAMQLAKTRLGYARLESPLAGVVLSKNVEPGEYVAPGTPVVTVGDVVNVWLRAYITANDLTRVKVDQRAAVTIDGRDTVYEGRVSFISAQAEFTPKNVQTQKERVKLVYRIKIDIRNTEMELKPGMPADAVIYTE